MATGVTEKNGKCFIRWYERGKRHSRALDIPYTREGVSKAARIRKKFIENGEQFGRPVPTFGELAQKRLDETRMSPNYRVQTLSCLNNYASQWFDWPVNEITYADLLPLSNLDAEPTYIILILTHIRNVFNLAIKSKWMRDNPAGDLIKEVKRTPKEVDPFTPDERDAILKDLKNSKAGHNKYLFYLIRFYTGMRPGEVIALTWDDYKDGEFRVNKGWTNNNLRPTKTYKERRVPVHPLIQAELKKTPRSLKNRHIILSEVGENFGKCQMFVKAFNRSRNRLGLRYRSAYNARHTAACVMLEAGMKPGYCASILGHSLQVFFRVYARWIDSDENKVQASLLMSLK